MHKFGILATLAVLLAFGAAPARAAADKQAFAGGGIGFELLSKDGSGTGFYMTGHGGYNFNSMVGIGLTAGFSKVSSVNIKVIDYGTFLQITEPESGLYGRALLGGIHASTPDGGTRNGVAGNDDGFAAGVALGILIPSVGDFHMVPELSYKAAFLEDTVNLIAGTFNLVWDL